MTSAMANPNSALMLSVKNSIVFFEADIRRSCFLSSWFICVSVRRQDYIQSNEYIWMKFYVVNDVSRAKEQFIKFGG